MRRHTVALHAELTNKLVIAARGAGLSVSGLIAQLVQRMEVDTNGAPMWIVPDEDLFSRSSKEAPARKAS